MRRSLVALGLRGLRSAALVLVIALPLWWLASTWYEARLLADRQAHVAVQLAPYVDEVREELHKLSGGHFPVAAVPTGGWDASIQEPLLVFRVLGLVIVGLLVSLVLVVANRKAGLELAVEERTQEITRVNEELRREVAERRQAESVLEEAQRALSTLMTNLPGMAYRCQVDRERSLEFASEGSHDLTGYHPAELVGRGQVSYGQLIYVGDRDRVWGEIQTALLQSRPFRLFYRITTADGSVRWVLDQGRGVVSPRGRLVALEGLVVDMTDRVVAHKMMEKRVADRTRQLSALYDVTAVASSSLDLETILERSLDRILTAVGGEIGGVQLLSEADGGLRLAASRGLPKAAREELDSPTGDYSLAGWVMRESRPIVVPDLAQEPRAGEGHPMARVGTYVGVPIRAKGQAMGVLSAVRGIGRPFDPDEVALLGAIGDQLGVAVENARLFVEAQGKAVLEERQRLARELHDSVTQLLYGLALTAETGRRAAGAGELGLAQDSLSRMGEIALQALKEMRLLVHELRPPALDQGGLVGALRQRLDAVEGRAGVATRLQVDGPLSLPAAGEDALYRVAQEALNNALKHSAATSVVVRLHGTRQQVELTVVDDGVGFEPAMVSGRGGLGLVSMRERVEQLGGSLTVTSAPGAGTAVTACVPTSERGRRGRSRTAGSPGKRGLIGRVRAVAPQSQAQEESEPRWEPQSASAC